MYKLLPLVVCFGLSFLILLFLLLLLFSVSSRNRKGKRLKGKTGIFITELNFSNMEKRSKLMANTKLYLELISPHEFLCASALMSRLFVLKNVLLCSSIVKFSLLEFLYWQNLVLLWAR